MNRHYLFNWVPWIGFILALSLRLWHLGMPPQIVSDEISFVTGGRSYTTQQAYFDPHPPLGKMQIGAAIGVLGDRPVVWRLANAVEGALIVPLLWWIAWRLTKRRAAANIAMALALFDGLLLVDSRLGLINIPYLLASLLSFASILKALEARQPRRWLAATGIFFGLALATKWLAILAVVPVLALWFWPTFFGQQRNQEQSPQKWWFVAIAYATIPIIVYWVVFVVHFAWLGVPSAFWSTNLQMLNYHLSVPATGDPNAQPWWGWLLAWKPFPYWTDVQANTTSVIRSLPNVWVWWTGALVSLYSIWRGWREGVTRWLNIALLCAWIPFMFIQRVMYSYHAMVFEFFLTILLGIYLGRLWPRRKNIVIGYLIMAALVFIFFAPWYLNIPLSAPQTHWREWLPSWTIYSL